jgi:hypothetical protein
MNVERELHLNKLLDEAKRRYSKGDLIIPVNIVEKRLIDDKKGNKLIVDNPSIFINSLVKDYLIWGNNNIYVDGVWAMNLSRESLTYSII